METGAENLETLDNETEETEKEDTVSARLILTNQQKTDLREAFNLLDFTGEGKIKAEDFRVAIKALGYEPSKEELLSMIAAVDKGRTGKLSFENFETVIMRKIMSLDSDDDIMKSFRLFDTDDSGMISFDNLKRVTNILEMQLTDEEIEEMIDDADKDLDGCVWKLFCDCHNIYLYTLLSAVFLVRNINGLVSLYIFRNTPDLVCCMLYRE